MKPEESERLFIESLFEEAALSKSTPNVEKLTGDASTRRYFRLLDDAKSYVACLDSPLSRDEYHPFVETQKIFKSHGVRVPEIYHANYEKGFLLEEDLGNRTLLEVLGQAPDKVAIKNEYVKVLDELIKIHQIDPGKYKNIPLVDNRFDQAKLLDETRITNLNFVIKLLGTGEDDPSVNIIDQSFSKICSFLEDGPFVVTHRDFHSRNIMIVEDSPVVIDFQDARLGLPQYDLVSLLEDCYFFVNKEIKAELIRYYLDKTGLKMSNFEEVYDLMAVQRLYKAIGSFSMIYNTRGDSRYLKFIGRAFETILARLSKYDQYLELKLTLAKIYYAS